MLAVAVSHALLSSMLGQSTDDDRVVQPYTLKKQLEHSLKSLVQVRTCLYLRAPLRLCFIFTFLCVCCYALCVVMHAVSAPLLSKESVIVLATSIFILLCLSQARRSC